MKNILNTIIKSLGWSLLVTSPVWVFILWLEFVGMIILGTFGLKELFLVLLGILFAIFFVVTFSGFSKTKIKSHKKSSSKNTKSDQETANKEFFSVSILLFLMAILKSVSFQINIKPK